MCTEVSSSMILTRKTKLVLIRFEQGNFPLQSWVFTAYIPLCVTNYFFTFPYSHSFNVLLWSGVLHKTFHVIISTRKNWLMWCNPYAKTIHAFLSEHSLSGVKSIDYVLCVMRHARSVKTVKIVTYWDRKKKCLSFYVVSLQKKKNIFRRPRHFMAWI